MLLVEKPLDGVAVVTLNRPEAMNALETLLAAPVRHRDTTGFDGPQPPCLLNRARSLHRCLLGMPGHLGS